TLNPFIAAMKEIEKRAKEDPESFHDAPRLPVVSRPNETTAARNPKLRWRPTA
ncbi:MAG: aminomethyl-transferring glycine dehydrogenase subunit GcvPB, partial [Nitrospinae bacterium]|nr:aminomethyl-transferring glycine dehydrogenase subunit GcvPB [Nitrospinota bacterium]